MKIQTNIDIELMYHPSLKTINNTIHIDSTVKHLGTQYP